MVIQPPCAKAPSLILTRVSNFHQTLVTLTGFLEIPSWYVISLICFSTLIHIISFAFSPPYPHTILSSAFRKMCTRCSEPHRTPSDSPNYLLRLGGQVRDLLPLSRLLCSPPFLSQVLPLLLLVLGLLVCPSIFCGPTFFSYVFPPRFKRCRINHSLCIPDVFNRIYRYYHAPPLTATDQLLICCPG